MKSTYRTAHPGARLCSNLGWKKGQWYGAVPPFGRERPGYLHGGLFWPNDGGRPPGEHSRWRRQASAGCTSNDRLHFNSAGSREFGKRYGEKMLSLLGHQVAKPK
jgi:hypothetical protein